MRLRILIELAAALLLTFGAFLAISLMARAQDLRIEDAYARPSIGAATTGAAYLTVTNHGSTPDKLREVVSEVAKRSELHMHAMKGEVMTMRPVGCLLIPAGGSVAMAPGGLHVMLTGLAAPLKPGEQFPMRLKFDRAGEIAVNVMVNGQHAASHTAGNSSALEFCE
jgi:copper(I)-binding protein